MALLTAYQVLLTLILIPTLHAICDIGWVEHELFCYYFSNETLVHGEAQGQCERFSSHLVSVEHPTENDFIYQQIRLEEDSFWIGYTRVTPKIWRWLSSGTVGTYFNWDLGEPDGEGSCARITRYYLGKWRDGNCNQLHRYICRKLADCGEPEAVVNSAVITSAEKLISASELSFYAEGTIAHFMCNTGYEFEDGSSEKFATCTLGGQWTNDASGTTVGECEPKVCELPPLIANAETNGTADRHYEFGDVVSYKCLENFWFSAYEQGETKYAVCTDKKTWSHDGLHDCTPITCIRPITTNAWSNTSSNEEGTAAHYWCDFGYKFTDNSTEKVFRCGKVGWDPSPMQCIIKKCPSHTVSYATGLPNSTDYGTTVIWRCNPGRMYSDTTVYKSMYCQETEEWSRLITDTCERM